MHYYKRNLGDYAKKAGRLSMLQHGSYTLLIDACYDRERFPTLEEAIEWTWASNTAEIEAVQFVLGKFFILGNGVYVQKRIQEELEDYRAKSETNTRIANDRETNRAEKRTNRARTVNGTSPEKHESPPNQEPITNNHKPNTKHSDQQAGSPIPFQKIIDLYHQKLPECRHMEKLTTKRKAQISARWKSGDLPDLETWSEYFDFVGQSRFLTGKTDPINGHKRFIADIEWITNETNFAKIYERKYHGEVR